MAVERSSSEPVLRQEDYHLPCHGVGETGPPKRLIQGPFTKDKGTFSSRINQIVRQAEKVPGPGKYVAHEDWGLTRTTAFAKGDRGYKPMNKVPPPTEYERKDFFEKPPNACKDVLSSNPRVLFGKISKCKRRSFLDGAIRHGAQVPGPGSCEPKSKAADRLDTSMKGALNWTRETQKHESKAQPEKSLAPNHYNPSFAQVEERLPTYSVPKEVGKNFLDKAVKEKWTDAKSKKEIPGPGTYETQNFDLAKTSRGTYHMQLRGLSRSAVCGYF